ncbi:MAG: hypothetical protein IKU48_01005 [Clostridia bacterium]|nr:hypothetical protein [Clostridia bacterium]
MKTHVTDCRRTEVKSRRNIVLDYSLIITDKMDCDLFDEEDIYSVLILQTEEGITTEYDFLYDIARDKENAVAILDLLVYNNVMPANARDVLADIL